MKNPQLSRKKKKYKNYIKIKIRHIFLILSGLLLISLIKEINFFSCLAFLFNWTCWAIYFGIDISEVKQ